ncbi:HD domain-containing protein [Anaerobacterium chartisolvens]|uniref:HD domain-containing protein n=1 Tax=Anaerobacterium chartisolvens TaxID=1297424 RepID=A0A369B196_9FIRM|nr:HD domain-containing phosphohydrolase [Anaerobacterium chartisolvens]RCX15450.1 HD domain-containing protein [Anaerobacterium chartisolvens]
MQIQNSKIALMDIIISISSLIDLVSPILTGHHKRVTYISLKIAGEMGLPKDIQNDIIIASLLHDSGALSLNERIETLRFEDQHATRHAEMGYRLLKDFPLFKQAARIIRHHHLKWNYGACEFCDMGKIHIGSHIIHLADRVDCLIDTNSNIINQTDDIQSIIKKHSGAVFSPQIVEAFLSVSSKEAFWLDTILNPDTIFRNFDLGYLSMHSDEFMDIAVIYKRIIDFRSKFTSTHSSGVAAVAELLGKIFKIPDESCRLFKAAGYMHDLGKLAIPSEILEKPGKLTKAEINIMKSHTYYLYHILEKVKGFEVINTWSSFHHEHLNGEGYPFRLKEEDLSIGSRILGVADIFTAITEDRPYRKGMEIEQALSVLNSMAKKNQIDADIVNSLINNFDTVNYVRLQSQAEALVEYNAFLKDE